MQTRADREAEPLPFHVVVVEDRSGRRPRHQAVVVVIGEIDLATEPRLRQALFDQLEDGKTDIIVDMIGVEFIDVCGMRTLLEAADCAQASGGGLRLQSPSRPVRRVLGLLASDVALPITQ
jgi:anti-anti-sigma factor